MSSQIITEQQASIGVVNLSKSFGGQPILADVSFDIAAPVYIFGQIESQNQRGASAISLVLLALSFALMLFVDWLQERREK